MNKRKKKGVRSKKGRKERDGKERSKERNDETNSIGLLGNIVQLPYEQKYDFDILVPYFSRKNSPADIDSQLLGLYPTVKSKPINYMLRKRHRFM